MIFSFRFHFSPSRKIDITMEYSCPKFTRSKFFGSFSLSLFFPLLQFLNALIHFVIFIYSVHRRESVHTLLGPGIPVKFKYFIPVLSTVHLVESGRAQCSVSFVPISDLQSAEHLFKTVRGLFQSVIRRDYRLSIDCTPVAMVQSVI